MRRRDNVGGLVERVTCHMFWFLRRPFFCLSLFLGLLCTIAHIPILTIYTSYGVLPRKDVTFEGPLLLFTIYGIKSPPTTAILGREWPFSGLMYKILKAAFGLIMQNGSINVPGC